MPKTLPKANFHLEEIFKNDASPNKIGYLVILLQEFLTGVYLYPRNPQIALRAPAGTWKYMQKNVLGMS